MKMKYWAIAYMIPLSMFLGGAGGDGCSSGEPSKQSAASMEQTQQNLQSEQFLRNQPVPSIEWSLERHMVIQTYVARQRATSTHSVVQSEFTGKILWQCDSIGFPVPYSTQLTNPLQAVWMGSTSPNYPLAGVAIAQPEPNGLYPPPTSDATFVPCVDEKGNITPVYEEKKVTTFVRSVSELDGKLIVSGAASLSISPNKK